MLYQFPLPPQSHLIILLPTVILRRNSYSYPTAAAIMDDEKEQALHVEVQQAAAEPNPKKATVVSVALTDALAKDAPQYLSWSMFRLYGIMLLVTLSKLLMVSLRPKLTTQTAA